MQVFNDEKPHITNTVGYFLTLKFIMRNNKMSSFYLKNVVKAH